MPRPDSRLRDLAAVYFHQDYDREYPDADSALRDFASGYEPDFVAATVADINGLLSDNLSEEELKELWRDRYNAYFEPDKVGLTYRAWFEHMLEVLREG